MIKVLNSINSEISNIDDAFLYKTVFGGKSGILAGRLNDCNIFQSSSNILTIDTGELLIYGVRVLIDEPIHFTLLSTPVETIEYELIIEVQLLANKSILSDIRYQIPNNLVKESLYKKNTGIYQLKLAKFTHLPDGSIGQLKIIVPKLYGGNTGLQVGNVTSAITDKILSVKIENVYNANKLLEEVNFDFKIPKGNQGKNGKSIRFRGEYNQMPKGGLSPDDDPFVYTYYNDIDYLDIVTYNGSAYVPKVGMVAGFPPDNTDYWSVLVNGIEQTDKIYYGGNAFTVWTKYDNEINGGKA